MTAVNGGLGGCAPHAAAGTASGPPPPGNDSRQKITFTGHVLAAILSRRFALPARAIAALLGCDRSTISHELPRTRQLLDLSGDLQNASIHSHDPMQ
jgi:hypothetical protein